LIGEAGALLNHYQLTRWMRRLSVSRLPGSSAGC